MTVRVYERYSTLKTATTPQDAEMMRCFMNGDIIHVYTDDYFGQPEVEKLAQTLASKAYEGEMLLEIHEFEEYSPPVGLLIRPGEVTEIRSERVWERPWPAPQGVALKESIDPDRVCQACGGQVTTGIFYKGQWLVYPHCTQCGREDKP